MHVIQIKCSSLWVFSCTVSRYIGYSRYKAQEVSKYDHTTCSDSILCRKYTYLCIAKEIVELSEEWYLLDT